MTLKEFVAIGKRYNEKKEDDDYQYAGLLAHIHNRTIQTNKERPKNPEDFIAGKELEPEELEIKILGNFKAYRMRHAN